MRKLFTILAVVLATMSAAYAQKATVKYNQYGVAVDSDVLDAEA